MEYAYKREEKKTPLSFYTNASGQVGRGGNYLEQNGWKLKAKIGVVSESISYSKAS